MISKFQHCVKKEKKLLFVKSFASSQFSVLLTFMKLFFFSILVSVIPICICVGTIGGGILAEKIGYLWCLRISLFMQMLGWIAIYWAESFAVLIVGRIVKGLGSGLCGPAAYLILTDLSLIR